MKTLNKTMVQFVLEKYKRTDAIDSETAMDGIYDYAKFLSTPLSLGMFIPTGEDGNVLKEPYFWDNNMRPYNPNLSQVYCDAKIRQFNEAKECVLFEGFEKCDRNLSVNCIYNKKLDLHINADFKFEKTIEDLVKYNLTLKENALKNII